MPLPTKITFSNEERSLMINTEWILLKHRIIQKISELFAGWSQYIINDILPVYKFPVEVTCKPPKISRGEQYRHLPYLVLDCPSFFNKQDIFALRTIFWWGNFISINLHVAGNYIGNIDLYAVVKESRSSLPLYVSLADTQWEHHFGEDNFVLMDNFSVQDLERMAGEKGFLKFALQFDLSDLTDIDNKLRMGYKQIAGLLINYPNDKKDL